MHYEMRVSPLYIDASRFFWWPEENLDAKPLIYWMNVHLFRARRSPSCASFCLVETAGELGKHFDSQIADSVCKLFYVDNCLG